MTVIKYKKNKSSTRFSTGDFAIQLELESGKEYRFRYYIFLLEGRIG